MTSISSRTGSTRLRIATAANAMALLIFALCLVLPLPGYAANGAVTCVVANSTLAFNAYDPISGAADILPTGTINVLCSSTSNQAIIVSYSLTLATSPTRAMASGADSLSYDLYTDIARTIPWNTTNTVGCTAVLAAKSINQQIACTFYGRIPGSQNVPAGTYTQTGLAVGGTWSCNPVPSGGC